MKMFTQNELLLMIGIVGTLLVLITILTIFDIKDYLKKKKDKLIKNNDNFEMENTEFDKMEPVEVFEVPDNEVVVNDIKLDDITEEITPIENKEEDIFIEEDEVIEPTNILQEEPLSIQVNEVKKESINLEEEFNKALEEIPNEDDAITKFEEEQERTAIISLDELIKKSDELYNNNEDIQYDDGNEPITIDEIIAKYNKQEEPKEVVTTPQIDEVEERPLPYSKKETIPFISSVYGLEKNNQLEFENTATYEKLSRENTKDFMTRLREEMNENK